MKLIKIPKKSGAFRTVCSPDKQLKETLRAMVDGIEAKARKQCPDEVLHGFTKGRSPVTNALAHVDRRYTLCFDMEDFFDSVTADKLRTLSAKDRNVVLIDPHDGKGARALQGLPTSPAVANLAAAKLDRAILRFLKNTVISPVVYTRYADDLTFSFDYLHIRSTLLCKIPALVNAYGFKINQRKTRFQPASAGRRVITGVAVDDEGVHATRSVRRRIRAAVQRAGTARTHALRRHASRSANGLLEWSKLKLPADYERAAI